MDQSPFSSSSPPPATVSADERRALVRHYKDNPPAMGIYTIRGASGTLLAVRAGLNVHGAMQRDRFELRMGSHRDHRLQQVWATLGEAAFCFEQIDTLKPRDDDPGADYKAALAELLALWKQELQA